MGGSKNGVGYFDPVQLVGLGRRRGSVFIAPEQMNLCRCINSGRTIMKKIFGFLVLTLSLSACQEEIETLHTPQNAEWITITATLAPKAPLT